MSNEISRRRLFAYGAGTLITPTVLAACSSLENIPQFTTNATNRVNPDSFGDKDFDIKTRGVDMEELAGTRIFGRLATGDTFTDTQGNRIPGKVGEEIFEYWSLRTDEVQPLLNPVAKHMTYSRADNRFRIWVHEPRLEKLVTNRRYIQQIEMDEDGRGFTLSEPRFDVPAVSIGNSAGMPYTMFINDKGAEILGVVANPQYEFVNEGTTTDDQGLDVAQGRIALLGGKIYEERLATVESLPAGFNKIQLQRAKAIYQKAKVPAKIQIH
jgi:hypothetical protein